MIPETGTATTLGVSIVLHESDLGLLQATLEHLARAVCRARDSDLLDTVSVTVLDNASSDEYGAAAQALVGTIAESYPAAWTFSYRQNPRNVGFGSGHNLALQDCQAEYLLVLNPDVELAATAINEGLRFLREQSDAVAVNPLCKRDNGSREFLCKRYPSLFDLLLRGLGVRWLQQRFAERLAHYEYRELDDTRPGLVTLTSGACLLLRARDFRACAGFDAGYFLYFEDFDLAMRLSHRGALYYLPSMRVVHHGGFAARKGLRHVAMFLRSAVRFYSIHGWRLR
ncbi:MAG: GT2 family glycosyltransferase [Halieaceae bacterium]|jgi:GT2 family glycosyltransferase